MKKLKKIKIVGLKEILVKYNRYTSKKREQMSKEPMCFAEFEDWSCVLDTSQFSLMLLVVTSCWSCLQTQKLEVRNCL